MVSFSKDINTVRAKLSDFGTSRSSSETMKMTSCIGTPAFMAPEVFDGAEYGKKSDVYSYGMTVCSIYSETNPFFIHFLFLSGFLIIMILIQCLLKFVMVPVLI